MCVLSRLQCTIMQFKMAPKKCIKRHRPHRPWKINQTGRSNRKREYAAWTQFDCSNEKRWTESWNWVYFYPRLCVVRLIEVSDMRDLTVYNLSLHVLSLHVLLLHVYHSMFYHSSRCYTTPAHSMFYHNYVHAVDSLNIKHELQSKRVLKAILYHVDISRQ